MQETDFYQQLLALPDLQVQRVEYTPTRITLFCQLQTPSQACPHCLKQTAQLNQYTTRQVRDLDMSGRQVWLYIRLRQFICQDCNRYFSQSIPFAQDAKSYTDRQTKWIVECCARQPFTEVGALLDICPKTVERLYYNQVQTHLNLPARYARVRRLGIDEIAHRKGKANYACVLTDLDRGIALDILPSRSKEALLTHFKQLGPAFCRQIVSVSFDMWPAYHKVSLECFPQAVRVVDRFHVVKALNNVLDRLRRKLRQDYPWKLAFLNIKWLLFKAHPSSTEQIELERAFKQSSLLKALVGLRNSFHQHFEGSADAPTLLANLKIWLVEATALGYAGFSPFLTTLTNWLEPIANYAHERLTNAVTEGLNNVIRYVKRISYGLPNFAHLRLRVLAQAI
jgi:transposase